MTGGEASSRRTKSSSCMTVRMNDFIRSTTRAHSTRTGRCRRCGLRSRVRRFDSCRGRPAISALTWGEIPGQRVGVVTAENRFMTAVRRCDWEECGKSRCDKSCWASNDRCAAPTSKLSHASTPEAHGRGKAHDRRHPRHYKICDDRTRVAARAHRRLRRINRFRWVGAIRSASLPRTRWRRARFAARPMRLTPSARTA
jgi:hypothetical protein